MDKIFTKPSIRQDLIQTCKMQHTCIYHNVISNNYLRIIFVILFELNMIVMTSNLYVNIIYYWAVIKNMHIYVSNIETLDIPAFLN